MSQAILDASAILAIIQSEPGHEKLTAPILESAVASAVNIAEVQARLRNRGWSSEEAWADAMSPVQEIVSFSSEQARIAGDLVVETRALGLSFGDRACLALALTLRSPVYTADRSWKKLKIGVSVEMIR